ncbi:MAG: alpha-amylase family glycosyl hydrolase [Candidatus Sumerlaeia bacterium]|nr:alpha-amylase family glycosyl hydrolase [Candidatus Sumerlaeia bacterium]
MATMRKRTGTGCRRAALAAGLAIAGAAAQAQQGTATLAPAVFDRGDQVTVTYDATGGPLAGASPVHFYYGFNGFQNIQQPQMTSLGGNRWSFTFTFPQNATNVDFVFRNASSTIFDNNSQRDWRFWIDLSGYPMGATQLSAAEGFGVVFRVWTPNSTSASVAGSFNGFSTTANAMREEGATNIWSAFIPNAARNNTYKYVLNGSNFRQDPRSRELVNSVGDSRIVDPATFNWQNDNFTMPPANELVIYQLHIGTFEALTAPVPSTFVNAQTRLDYLADLGVNAVKLMPISEFAGGISAGYNKMNPYTVEANYGRTADLKEFIRQCHLRGIGVILDVVHNHYGPTDLDLYNFDGGTNGGAYFYNTPTSLAETPFGPRPNYSTPEVRDYIKDNIQFWLEEFRVDGFRWDFTKGIRGQVDGGFNITAPIPDGVSLLREINDFMAANHPDAIRIAEDLGGEPLITTPTSNPNGFGFQAEWEVGFHSAVVGELEKSVDANRSTEVLAAQIDDGIGFTRVHYLESHDEVWTANNKFRTAQRYDTPDPQGLRSRRSGSLAAALWATSEGIPMLFQGQELHISGGWNDTVATTWSLANSTINGGIKNLYADLIRLRRNADGISRGLTSDRTEVFLNLNNIKVFAYRRWQEGGAPGDDVVVLMNLSSTSYPVFEIGLPQAGTWYEAINTDSKRYSSDFGDFGVGQVVTTTPSPQHGYAQRGAVALPAYSAVILSRARRSSANGFMVR